MKESLVSIIVPIFKAEKFLPKCLDSILAQSYQNLEIVLVDDGSPDNCPKICDEYAKKDARIKVIHKQNSGVANTRNVGLDNATGDFFAFVDSDDWIEPNYVQTMLDKQKQYDCDFVCCSVMDVAEKDGSKNPNIPVNEDEVLCGKDIIAQYYAKYCTILTVPWNKLYKRQIFDNLRYPKDRMYYDDTAIILQLLAVTKKIVIIKDVLYNYFKRDNSLMSSKISKQNVTDIILNFQDRVEFLLQNKLNEFVSEEIARRFCDMGWAYRTCKDKPTKKHIKTEFKALWKKYHKYIKLNSLPAIKMYINAAIIKLF